MKQLLTLQNAISLCLICVLGIFITTSNTTVEQSHDEAIKELSEQLAQIKAELASIQVIESEAELSSEPFIAEVTLFGGNFAPRGWAFCEGQTLAIASNQALFSLLGTTYGGDGRTSFKLPDLRQTEAQLNNKRKRGVRYIIALQGIFPSRS